MSRYFNMIDKHVLCQYFSAENHTVPSSQQTYTKRNKMTSQTFLSASYIQTTQVSTDNDHPVSGHLHHVSLDRQTYLIYLFQIIAH